MAVIDINAGSGSADVTVPEGPIGWIQQATNLINSINQLINSITSNPFIASRIGGSSDVVQSSPGAKQEKSNPPAKKEPMDMDQYFQTSEGMMKIAQAIDMVIPLTGDIKLSELKKSIKDLVSKQEVKKDDKAKK